MVAIALGPLDPGGLAHGLITVERRGEPFSDEDRELLRSLATQATLALENVELHFQTQRVSAATDGDKAALIADADSALYAAKRQGKNRTVRARSQTANVIGAE